MREHAFCICCVKIDEYHGPSRFCLKVRGHHAYIVRFWYRTQTFKQVLAKRETRPPPQVPHNRSSRAPTLRLFELSFEGGVGVLTMLELKLKFIELVSAM